MKAIRSKAKSCTGKRRHRTEAAAEAHIEKLSRELGAPVDHRPGKAQGRR